MKTEIKQPAPAVPEFPAPAAEQFTPGLRTTSATASALENSSSLPQSDLDICPDPSLEPQDPETLSLPIPPAVNSSDNSQIAEWLDLHGIEKTQRLVRERFHRHMSVVELAYFHQNYRSCLFTEQSIYLETPLNRVLDYDADRANNRRDGRSYEQGATEIIRKRVFELALAASAAGAKPQIERSLKLWFAMLIQADQRDLRQKNYALRERSLAFQEKKFDADQIKRRSRHGANSATSAPEQNKMDTHNPDDVRPSTEPEIPAAFPHNRPNRLAASPQAATTNARLSNPSEITSTNAPVTKSNDKDHSFGWNRGLAASSLLNTALLLLTFLALVTPETPRSSTAYLVSENAIPAYAFSPASLALPPSFGLKPVSGNSNQHVPMSKSQNPISRRLFLRDSALAASALALTTPLASAASASDKLNIGIIGAGGRGGENLKGVQSENIVALCDVDDDRAADAFKKYPKAKRYKDYRQMLEKEKSIEAVTVSLPDHSHAMASILSMRMGKHVYCEKPLTRTIWEARQMRKVAAETKSVTQMGQQGHAMEGSRRAVEVIRSGAIGEVREIHVWTDRPAGWWPQGIDAPTDGPSVPATLDWDLWLGPAASRPYNPIYVPFKWRGFYDFGTGAIGDMAIHNLDTAYWALELGLPATAEVKASDQGTKSCPPLWNIIELQFPARGHRPPVKVTYYDGKKLPPADLFLGEAQTDNGSLVIGSKGTLYTRTWHGGESAGDMFLLLPRKQFVDYQPPAPTLPRTPEHHIEWIQACKGGPRTQSDFAYASTITEALLVGLLAQRTGHKIEWDAEKMAAKGVPDADQYIRPQFRKGWSI